MAKLTNKQIEKISIKCVMEHLRSEGEKPETRKHGADIISGDKYIEVKGCLKKETNIRMTQQALKSISEAGKLKQGSFYTYYVLTLRQGTLS